jgi:hypothetical protein
MLYLASCIDEDTNEWLGGVLINRETQAEAANAAGRIACSEQSPHLEIALLPVPAGAPPIHASLFNRLLTFEEVNDLAPGGLIHFEVGADGAFERIDD